MIIYVFSHREHRGINILQNMRSYTPAHQTPIKAPAMKRLK